MVIYCIIAVTVGMAIMQLVLRPKLKTTQELDRKVIKENEEQRLERERLNTEVKMLSDSCSKYQSDIRVLQTSLKEQSASIEETLEERRKAAEAVLGDRLDVAAERKRQEYLQQIQEVEDEYIQTLQECSYNLNRELVEKQSSITELILTLDNLKSKVQAINEENKRAEEIKSKADFYKLQISDVDLEEVQKLRKIAKELRDPVPLNKMIWTQYFRNLYSALCGRVVGAGTKTGIYKITNLENGMAYIGQSRNIKDRWADHIKVGLGADTVTRNKLYPAMLSTGVENFTFEILEICSAEELNEREKFYIDFYDTVNYGYNVTKGGS